MANYYFDEARASKYGVYESILLEYFIFWIGKNKASKKNLHDERIWTYNTIISIQKLYSFLSYKQVRNTLASLIRQGVLIKSEYNKNKWDRTAWYAFANEEEMLSGYKPCACAKDERKYGNQQPDPGFPQEIPFAQKGSSESAQTGSSIPVLNTVNKTGKEEEKKTAPPFLEKKEEEQPATHSHVAAAARPKETWLVSRRNKPLSERKKLLQEHVGNYNSTRKNPWPQPLLRDFVNYWTQPNLEHTLLKYESINFFGISWHIESFWRKASSDEKRAYFEKAEMERGRYAMACN